LNDKMSKKTCYHDFFERILTHLKERRPQVNWQIVDHPVGWNWAAFYRVKYNIWYGAGFTKDNNFRVGLHIGHKDASSSQLLFDQFKKRQEIIEYALGFSLTWHSPRGMGTQAGLLAVYKPGTIYDKPEYLEELEEWTVDMIVSLRTGLTSYLHEILMKAGITVDKLGENMEDKRQIHKLKGKKLLIGTAASPGIAMGNVRNIGENTPELMAKMLPGEVVVAKPPLGRIEADLLKMASAVVIDTGARTCGVAIIARELGIPAIVHTIDGTKLLRIGQKVIVDGTEGIVYSCV